MNLLHFCRFVCTARLGSELVHSWLFFAFYHECTNKRWLATCALAAYSHGFSKLRINQLHNGFLCFQNEDRRDNRQYKRQKTQYCQRNCHQHRFLNTDVFRYTGQNQTNNKPDARQNHQYYSNYQTRYFHNFSPLSRRSLGSDSLVHPTHISPAVDFVPAGLL